MRDSASGTKRLRAKITKVDGDEWYRVKLDEPYTFSRRDEGPHTWEEFYIPQKYLGSKRRGDKFNISEDSLNRFIDKRFAEIYKRLRISK